MSGLTSLDKGYAVLEARMSCCHGGDNLWLAVLLSPWNLFLGAHDLLRAGVSTLWNWKGRGEIPVLTFLVSALLGFLNLYAFDFFF